MRKRNLLLWMILLITIIPGMLLSQTTGKISGRVIDKKTGHPLTGAQVMITGKWIDNKEVELDEIMGTVTDNEGDFFIINVSPGQYTVLVQMMGYSTMKFTEVSVSVNRTVSLSTELQPTVIAGEEVIVTARVVEIKKDQTSSIRNVSSKDIKNLPVESLDQVVAMQPGIVAGHFRGGRSDEVSYMIDGIQVDESFGQTGRTVSVNPEVVSEVEVITGAFNAEYGRAMSGIVNMVTRDGGEVFKGSASYELGGYITDHNNIFIGLKDFDITKKSDLNFSLSGPLLNDRIGFILNGRFQDNKGHLYGIHRFNVDDYSNFLGDPSTVFSDHYGTGKYVNMEWGKNYSLFSKLTFKTTSSIKTSLIYNINDGEGQGYDHYYKYNPNGRATGYNSSKMIALQINHMIGKRAFYDIKLSHVGNYSGDYVFEDPYDSRYVHDMYSQGGDGCGFSTGGQQKHHSELKLEDINAKFDFNWQINKNHNVKTGIAYIGHTLDNSSKEIRNEYIGTEFEMMTVRDSLTNKMSYPYYSPVTMPDTSVYSDIYIQKPYEYSAYIQDKMEFNEMVINIGLRYDYFNPNTAYPSQLRNPANQLYFPLTDTNGAVLVDDDGNDIMDPERMSSYPMAKVKHQISPRIGLSYKLGSSALLRFCYGHFFQMPALYALYQNNSHLIGPTDYSTTNGNPNINAQKTIQYEVGLWQELMPGMELDVAVYYRDIYDLLSAKVITTYNQIKYGLYSNKDYGNVRGLEVKYNLNYEPFIASINYTFQYTKGNADSPTFTFSRAGSNIDPVNRMIPMSWDQRHTLNISVGYYQPKYGTNLTVFYDSGTPYTWTPIAENPLSRVNLYPNNDVKPTLISVDLNAYYNVFNYRGVQGRLTLLVYNLLDRLNEVAVYGSTGRAYTTVARESEINSHQSDFNDYWDAIHNPAMYSAPRMFKIGFEVSF